MTDAIDSVEEAALKLMELKRQKGDLESEIVELEQYLDHQLADPTTLLINDAHWRVTPVRSATTKVNIPIFRELYPDVAAQCVNTKVDEVVDAQKLARYIQTGEIDTTKASAFIEIKPKKTSIRLTEVTDDEGEEESED